MRLLIVQFIWSLIYNVLSDASQQIALVNNGKNLPFILKPAPVKVLVQNNKRRQQKRNFMERCCANDKCLVEANKTSKEGTVTSNFIPVKLTTRRKTTTVKPTSLFVTTIETIGFEDETLGTTPVPAIVDDVGFFTQDMSALFGKTPPPDPCAEMPARKCLDFPGRLDGCMRIDDLIKQLYSIGETASGKLITTAAGRKYMIGFEYSPHEYALGHYICCMHGMEFAEFHTKEIWDDFVGTIRNVTSPMWYFFGSTMDNGNGTETWCNSQKLVAEGIFDKSFYENVTCGQDNAFVVTPEGTPMLVSKKSNSIRYVCM
ncbi:uncharacterized protein LOC132200721 [Neocloeon triangulifer]|uniref:uncharacterized protein LOC132200721 n=1 Tax=Neocloeon triangulifer TaxID=2078957 RepID=UPI00286F4817|nr:uncharacterized protein LOC132200721 [Neocloeon triangulifer]